MQLLELPDVLHTRNTFGYFEDFDYYVTGETFSTVATDSGAISVSDGAGGIITLDPSDGSIGDNDEAYLKGTREIFLFANDKPLVFETRLKFVEANTDDANILAGVMDAVAANALVDDGGGPPASYSGANFHKIDGGTKWLVETSIAGSQTTTLTTTTAGGAGYQTLRIEFKPLTATEADVTFYVDGVPVQDANGREVKHRITYMNATEMQTAVGVKNGGTNRETLLVDYIAAFQKR